LAAGPSRRIIDQGELTCQYLFGLSVCARAFPQASAHKITEAKKDPVFISEQPIIIFSFNL
jgi:hypothetical protein